MLASILGFECVLSFEFEKTAINLFERGILRPRPSCFNPNMHKILLQRYCMKFQESGSEHLDVSS